ncbi:DJ-1/PfpI family protein [Paenibacillus sp. P25]|nr:DJ-1/PfpI family protein [Paenibacillus sp. P25]
MKQRWIVGILLFDEVEVLDFAGPFEVFSVTAYADQSPGGSPDEKPFLVKTVSENGQTVNARNGLKIVPDYSFEDAPDFDIVVVPGGWGTRKEIENERVIGWIRERNDQVQLMTSVCTGALLLAKAGLLHQKKATTHWGSYDWLENQFPDVKVQRNVKFVDEDRIVTSGGISAGINMSFHVVKRLLGKETAQRTARRMEYDIDLDDIV